jgi:dienelactone hydrolase
MPVRALLHMLPAPGDAPYDRASLRLFYPARDTIDAHVRDTGLLYARAGHGPLPVIIFLPAVNAPSHSYFWLMHQFVAYGFAVALPEWLAQNVPGRVNLTPGIDTDALKQDIFGTRPTASLLAPVLDALRAMNAAEPLHGLLDLDRLVLGGHSAGGTLALQNARADWCPGVLAAFAYAAHPLAVLALGGWRNGVLPPLPDVPVMLVGGTEDGLGDQYNTQYGRPGSEGWEGIVAVHDECYDGGRADQYVAVLEGANHFTICSPLDESIGRAFLDRPETRPGDALRRLIQIFFAGFLKGHVLGDEAAREVLGSWVQGEDSAWRYAAVK